MEKTFKNRKNFKSLVGKKIGRLEILREESYTSKAGKVLRGYLCHCECGNEKVISHSSLISGRTNSCGCLMTEFNKGKKGNDYWKYRNGKRKSTIKGDRTKERLHRIWKNMKQRCTNPNFPDYKKYGARGITICDEWLHNFQAFYNWAIENGYADELTIDRINNDGNYEPSNCQWITNKEQQYNKRTNTFLSYKGITKTEKQWAEILGIKCANIGYRVRKGLNDEDCILGIREDTRERNKKILEEYFKNL